MSRFDDPREVAAERKAKKDDKQSRVLRELAVRGLLASVEGRAYLWWLLEIGKWGTNPFSESRGWTEFQCGELNVGQQILAHVLSVDPTGFIRMQQEANDVANRKSTDPDPNSESDPDADSDT